MVGHLHVGVQFAASRPDRLTQPFPIGEVVFLSEEAGVAVMSALNDMHGQTSEVDTRTTRNDG